MKLFLISVLALLAAPALAHEGSMEHLHLTEGLSITVLAVLFLLALGVAVWMDIRAGRRTRSRKDK